MKWLQFTLIWIWVVASGAILMTACEDDNQPPATIINYYPADNDTGVKDIDFLSWTGLAVANDTVWFDIYLDTVNPPALVRANSLMNSYSPQNLKPRTKYYWQIKAHKQTTTIATSPVWKFQTAYQSYIPGDLEVWVSDSTKTSFFGGAEVYLYLSEADRANDTKIDQYYQMGGTANNNPYCAMFYSLKYRKYYLYCRREIFAGTYATGIADCVVQIGCRTKIIVAVKI